MVMVKEKKGLSMTTQIVIALILGIAFGYFLIVMLVTLLF